jgi:hypothetical protein
LIFDNLGSFCFVFLCQSTDFDVRRSNFAPLERIHFNGGGAKCDGRLSVPRPVFRHLKAATFWLFGIFSYYILWSELVVKRVRDTPSGNTTSGLLYPFLNNLELSDRAAFYGASSAVAIIFLAIFSAVAWGVRRLIPRL